MFYTQGHKTGWHKQQVYWSIICWGKLVDSGSVTGGLVPFVHYNHNDTHKSMILHSRRAPKPLRLEGFFNCMIREVLIPLQMWLGLEYNIKMKKIWLSTTSRLRVCGWGRGNIDFSPGVTGHWSLSFALAAVRYDKLVVRFLTLATWQRKDCLRSCAASFPWSFIGGNCLFARAPWKGLVLNKITLM